MKSFVMAVAAVAGLAMFGGSTKTAEANHYCGGYGGYYGGYGGYGGYGYGRGYYSYPRYGYYGGGWGRGYGGYYGGWGNSVGFRSNNFGFRARW
jgi:hypothetical protein